MTEKKTKSNNFSDPAYLLPRILDAGLSNDRDRLHLLTASAIRAMRETLPELSSQLSQILADNGAALTSTRGINVQPPPSDRDTSAALLRVDHVKDTEKPILCAEAEQAIQRFLRSRNGEQKLMAEGLLPPRTLLLVGPPGTGKTLLAKWLASQLEMPIAALDLATVISSYLGKTGFNLRKTLDYGRANRCVMFLDEFDAIAKRRTDETEIGELKRIVNVLLKDLEDWPSHSVLVAATNHPELLDPAIPRRFDLSIEMPLPQADERGLMLRRSLGRHADQMPECFFQAIARLLDSKSGSDIINLGHTSLRRHLIDSEPLLQACLKEAQKIIPKRFKTTEARALLEELQKASGEGLTFRELAEISGLSASTVHYHLKNRKHHA